MPTWEVERFPHGETRFLNPVLRQLLAMSSSRSSPGPSRRKRRLEPWDESDLPVKGRSGAPVGSAGPGSGGGLAPWDEGDSALLDLAEIEAALTQARRALSARAAARTTGPARTFSPFFAQRVHSAREAAARLLDELAQPVPDARVVDGAVASVHLELERAHQEYEFLRSGSVASRAVPYHGPTPAAERRLARATTSGEPEAAFSSFTSARYNRSVGRMQRGRRRLLAATVFLSAGISALLLTLTLIAQEPNPTLALRVLPLVWLVPVPFFFLAFRGTYRMLSGPSLGVAEVA